MLARYGGALLAAILLASCADTYTANLEFARATGLGYRNVGLFTVGSLYLWDSEQNTLILLDDNVPLVPRPSTEEPTLIVSTEVRGISVVGRGVTPANEASAELAVGRQVQFRAEGAVRERYSSVYTGLSSTYVAQLAAGDDVRTRWRVDDASRLDSPLRYVVITGLVRADLTRTIIGGIDSESAGTFRVSVPELGSINVQFTNAQSSECAGDQAPCFFEVTVLKPYIGESGTLQYQPVPADLDRLSDAFRTL